MRVKFKSERAAAMVEAAIVLPVLGFLLFGLIQYALIFMTEANLRAAAATAARMVSVSNPPATRAELESAARAAATSTLDGTRLTVAVVVDLVGNTKRLDLTYNLPLLVPYLVPNSVGGVLPLASSATGKCNGVCTVF